jgi:hypothetical protein
MHNEPHQLEALLSAEARLAPILAEMHDLSRLAVPQAATRMPPELRTLLRSMNSYYRATFVSKFTHRRFSSGAQSRETCLDEAGFCRGQGH